MDGLKSNVGFISITYTNSLYTAVHGYNDIIGKLKHPAYDKMDKKKTCARSKNSHITLYTFSLQLGNIRAIQIQDFL